MDEQEILSRLKEHVARHRGFSSDDQRPVQPRFEGSTIDLSNISRLSAELWAAREAVGQINPRNPGLLNDLAQAIKKVLRRSLSWYTRSLQAFHYKVGQAIEEHATAINSIERSLARLEDELLKMQSDILAAIEGANKPSESEVLQESLRAAELAIQEQQGPYVEFFRGLSPVVDVGCGRGEFLELLKENAIAAYGVDSDPAACEAARRKFLKVVEADLFEHLRQLPDRSLGGAFSARVIEYLPTHQQAEFISLLSKKVKPGGSVVIETMNPESRLGFGRNSRLDPPPLHALHPELLKSLLESSSFEDVRICSLAPAEGLLALATSSSDSPDHSEPRRRLIPSVAPRLSSIQAYAAVARRSRLPELNYE
ncbi:MAG: class I SAM-dependent methyltransferase [Candidatus Korobacteraceae bacterium]|jgi:SAM-dependent methyltransferase